MVLKKLYRKGYGQKCHTKKHACSWKDGVKAVLRIAFSNKKIGHKLRSFLCTDYETNI